MPGGVLRLRDRNERRAASDCLLRREREERERRHPRLSLCASSSDNIQFPEGSCNYGFVQSVAEKLPVGSE